MQTYTNDLLRIPISKYSEEISLKLGKKNNILFERAKLFITTLFDFPKIEFTHEKEYM